METTDGSLLSAEMTEDALYEQLLLQAAKEMQNQLPTGQESKQIRPQPGFCVKTKMKSSEKIFINVCKSDQIPPPPDLSEEGLVTLLESDDPSGYRIPMSLGEPHAEIDNSSNGCTAYDIVINSKFYNKIQNNKLFMEFFLTIGFEGLENKYNLELSREWRMLKNRKFLGSISEQNIRTKSKPVIQELESSTSSPGTGSNPLISEVESTCVEPEYTIVAEPADEHPSFLVAEISLPKVDSAGSLLLDLGEDRIVLWARPDLYHLDIYIPYNIVQEESGSQFNRKSRILTVTMPVQPA
ncbi:PIH1 domain-containing protein 1 [Scyliorhinus canicula]|uniref:PIH1 domain-containing protein 1 n=1 Tax=Scyliorhinus canicula TaxID=7830 RepID=UPI0018F54815|nr:PIH1 domain-containing protein 1 [Scyliorhinus canicula]XP_038639393.1 PIH1 domain-containing protein 1 [Scyliorhinus canicula]XP_038639394.1 PIH1 domain-containing protein 1 [Scyliorhinus canicula]XP_038639395.1 PIH1 domain-containing protein 1 [Scyliorhinus canicula]XP_038639396.1 PIH1 domain-containing protein 1 [Scyliorhinus canicula]XP_038639397.1 PIH1 domain-containing protein 1 [Scyliorhinus canicula]XP_038639398.1 PIH1 domain-containing protein 1 [Scyliorhinus canicula]